MKEWKVRQEVFHRLHTTYTDDLNTKDIELSENVIDNAVRYFTERDIGWIYPAKSYMVSICYATWLAQHFGGVPLDYLNDPDLLFGNDPYFVPYDKDRINYDAILNIIGGWNFDVSSGMVPDVYEYFVEEFMINE